MISRYKEGLCLQVPVRFLTDWWHMLLCHTFHRALGLKQKDVFVHSLIPQTFVEHLLWVNFCAWFWDGVRNKAGIAFKELTGLWYSTFRVTCFNLGIRTSIYYYKSPLRCRYLSFCSPVCLQGEKKAKKKKVNSWIWMFYRQCKSSPIFWPLVLATPQSQRLGAEPY